MSWSVKEPFDIRNVKFYSKEGKFLWKEKQIFSRLHGIGDTFLRQGQTISIIDRLIIGNIVHYRLGDSNNV